MFHWAWFILYCYYWNDFCHDKNRVKKSVYRVKREKRNGRGGNHSSVKSLISATAKTFLISGAGPIGLPVISPHDGSVMPLRLWQLSSKDKIHPKGNPWRSETSFSRCFFFIYDGFILRFALAFSRIVKSCSNILNLTFIRVIPLIIFISNLILKIKKYLFEK